MKSRIKRGKKNSGRGQYVLITGGCGFIGTNLADRLLSEGKPVMLYDNLSRAGVEQNLLWLQEKHAGLVRFVKGDTRDRAALRAAVRGARRVFHFAAQVAVTTSLIDPVEDFEINAVGTLNLLEALRDISEPAPLVFTSTNKVYGGLDDLAMLEKETRYEPVDLKLLSTGISEKRVLDFHSPYGCSKGCADQYVVDYARTYGLPAAVFRMSCIYGPHQFGTEDQGWVAHFLIRALQNEVITLYGDGKQVRDILFVEDLVNAFLMAQENMDEIAGNAFNIGGGPQQTVSLLELLSLIEGLNERKPNVSFDEWRTGDQRYYVSDTRKFQAATAWAPRVSVEEGVQRLMAWLRENRSPVELSARARRNGHRRKRVVAATAEER